MFVRLDCRCLSQSVVMRLLLEPYHCFIFCLSSSHGGHMYFSFRIIIVSGTTLDLNQSLSGEALSNNCLDSENTQLPGGEKVTL
jgi:hypothetical protein